MNKVEILKVALEGRNEEIQNYQINIDNYVRAIDKINTEHTDNPAMIEFKDHLADMLDSSKTQQLKAIIIRDVIADQLTELGAI
jgi:Cys-tRNA synthase (O-phospho-L-seryl-tRNA:Cys-tRNA synthase)